MNFRVGEEVELFSDDGYNCGKYIIDEIKDDKVWFKRRPMSSSSYGGRPMDFLRGCRKIIKSGEQLMFDW